MFPKAEIHSSSSGEHIMDELPFNLKALASSYQFHLDID